MKSKFETWFQAQFHVTPDPKKCRELSIKIQNLRQELTLLELEHSQLILAQDRHTAALYAKNAFSK